MQMQKNLSIVGKFKLTEQQEILIREKVSRLPQQERLAIYFLFWEQHSHMRIAAHLGIAISDVPLLIQKAMAKLRTDLSEVANTYFGLCSAIKTELAA